MKLHRWNFISSMIFLCIQTKSINADSSRSTPTKSRNPLESSAQETKNPKVCTTDQCKKAAEYIRRNMNINVLPCDNFYQFACGNYHKWHPIPDYIDRMNPFREREYSLLEKSADALKKRTYESDAVPSIRKAREIFESCMNEEAIEKHGDLPIPIELNTLGLPMEPPFLRSVKRSYNLSKLLARMHRHAVMGKFLFDTSVFVDEVDYTKNHFAFNYTPSVTRFDAVDETYEEIMDNNLNLNARKNYVPLAVKRKALIEYMTKVINYVRENISGAFEKIAKTRITKTVAEVADFLMAVEQTKKKESPKAEDLFRPFTYMTMQDLQKMTDEIFQNENKETKVNHTYI